MASKNVQFAIEANNRSAMAALGQVEKGVAHLSERVTGPFTDAIAGAFSAEAVIELTKSVIDLGDDIDKTAKRLQTTTDNVQALQRIAEHSGGSLEHIEKGFDKIEEAAQDALGGDKIKKQIFDSLNISQDDLKHLNKVDLMSKVAAGSQGMGTAQKDQTFSELFGEKLGPTLQAASDELAHMAEIKEKMKASGEIMSDKDIAALVQMKDSWSDLITNLKVKFAPAITTVGDFINDFVTKIVQLAELFGTAIGAFSTVIETIKPWELVKSFGENMVNSFKALFSNLWNVIRGKESIGDAFAAVEEQSDMNLANSLTKGFDANAVDAAFQTVNDKLVEMANDDKAKDDAKRAREQAREQQQAKVGGNVERKGKLEAIDTGVTDKLASVGNLAIGGTAGVDFQFRQARTNEQIRDILKDILVEIRKSPGTFGTLRQQGYVS